MYEAGTANKSSVTRKSCLPGHTVTGVWTDLCITLSSHGKVWGGGGETGGKGRGCWGEGAQSEHRFPAPSLKEGCRKPVRGVWVGGGNRVGGG